MRFRCQRDVLFDAVTAAGRATRPTGSMPVLGCVRFRLTGDTLIVDGTDLTVAVEYQVTVAGERDGVALIPARLLGDVVKSLPAGAVHVDKPDGEPRVHVEAGRSQFDLACWSADEDFPRLPWPDDDSVAHEVPAKAFRAAIDRVTPAASGDDSRPILTGVHFEDDGGCLRVVGTDSYRLACQTLTDSSPLGTAAALVPGDGLRALFKLAGDDGHIGVRLGERVAEFCWGPLRVAATLIEGDYPKWGGLVPNPAERTGRLEAACKPLVDAVKRIGLLARESTPIRFKLGGDSAGLFPELMAVTQDVGQGAEQLDDCAYTGGDLTVAFNPQYLLDGLDACPTDRVWLDVVDGKKPAALRAVDGSDTGDPTFLYVLMPVRVS